jgi:hypothetical protein
MPSSYTPPHATVQQVLDHLNFANKTSISLGTSVTPAPTENHSGETQNVLPAGPLLKFANSSFLLENNNILV